HFRARLSDCHAGLELAPDEDRRVMGTIHPCWVVAAPHHRQPDICVLRRGHLRRHHADNVEILVVQSYRATKDSWVAVERVLPKTIADQNDGRSAHLVLVFTENATDFRWNSNHAEKISRHRSARNAFRITARDA